MGPTLAGMLRERGEGETAPDDMQLVPMIGTNDAHGLRPAEVGNARDEIRGLNLLPEQQARRIIGFGYPVHREAPRNAQQARRQMADDGSGIGEMVVYMGDSPPPQLPSKQYRLGEVDEGKGERASARYAVSESRR